ncbi:MAG: agmatinase [Synergistaceae bacterium]|jgi:agmatinase|nr:agmatinase [Synergistaceae bacterium]
MEGRGIAFIGCDAPYEAANAVIFGAPFDSTTTFRPGARFAPSAMRVESDGIETYSPYQSADLEDLRVFDAGDLELPFGNAAAALDRIESFVRTVIKDGKMPCMIGGEHLVTLGALRALASEKSGLHLVHFDAHADMRDDYMGEKLSHATVMRRAWEILGDGRIHQFGIRSGSKSEMDWSAGRVERELFGVFGLRAALDSMRGAPVYVTVDLDALDPSELPGTGTPEAGGLSFRELLDALISLKELDVRAFDICELSPHYDHSGRSTALACKVLREMLIAFARSSGY